MPCPGPLARARARRHDAAMPRLAVPLLFALVFAVACAAPPAPLPRADKALPLPGEAFLLAGREAFVLLPAVSPPGPQPWAL
jgi:hypothetical protein